MLDLDELKRKIALKNENLFVSVNDKITASNIKFSLTSSKSLVRALNLFNKEPATISWIRTFEENSIFFDIGANIGQFTLFAAIVAKSKVYSFEPESNNFKGLVENILLNKLFDKVYSYPIGISNKTELTTLYLSTFSRGQSHHMVGESLDHNLVYKNYEMKQGIFSTTLNELIDKWNFPIPNYLKIDVDGIEYKIIEKSDKILSSKNLNSVLIELNPKRKQDKKIIDILKNHGFIFNKEQVESSTTKVGTHKGYTEYLFYRK